MQFTKQDIAIDDTENLYQGFFTMKRFTLKHKLFEGGWTEAMTRECFMQGEAVAVILYDPQKKCVLLGEQFRIGALREESPWLLEPVAGRFEVGETPQEVALRETREEMGVEIKKLIPLFDFYSSPGASNEKVHYFCGIVDSSNKTRICGLKEENEDISVAAYALDDLVVMARENKIKDGITLIGIQWLQLNHATLAADVGME